VNKNGVKDFLRLQLSEEEQAQFKGSADSLKGVLKSIKF